MILGLSFVRIVVVFFGFMWLMKLVVKLGVIVENRLVVFCGFMFL